MDTADQPFVDATLLQRRHHHDKISRIINGLIIYKDTKKNIYRQKRKER